MELTNHIAFLDQAAKNQRSAQRYHLVFAVAIVALGLAVATVAQFSGQPNLKWLVTIGGTFASTLATFPLSELFRRRDRIMALAFLKRECNRLSAGTSEPAERDLAYYEERIQKFIDTILGE